MPRVPVYDQQRVAPAPTPGRALPSAAGDLSAGSNAVARGVLHAGAVLRQMYERERNEVDVATGLQVKSELATVDQQLLFGEGDEVGVYGSHGEDAIAAADAALRRRREREAEILKGLNPRLVTSLEPYLVDARKGFELQVARHEFQEKETFKTKAFETRLLTGQSAALTAAAAGDDAGFARVMNDVIADIEAYGDARGWGSDPGGEIDRRVDEWRSGTYVGAVGALIDARKSIAAKELYEDLKDDILPEHRPNIERSLASAVPDEQGLAIVREIEATLPALGERPDEAAIIAAQQRVNAIEDPAVLAAADRELTRRIADRAQAYEAAQSAMSEEVYRVFEETGEMRFTSDQRAKLSADRKEALYAIRDRHQARAQKAEPVTDWAQVYEQWDALTPAQRGALDTVLPFQGFMTESDFKVLRNEWKSLKDDAGRDVPSEGTFEQHFANAIGGLALTDGELAHLRMRGYLAVHEKRESLPDKRKLTDPELVEVVRDLVRPVYLRRHVFRRDDATFAGLLDYPEIAGKIHTAYVAAEDIPQEHFTWVRNVLRSRGELPPDPKGVEDAVEHAYLQAITGRDKGLADAIALNEAKALERATGPEAQERARTAVLDVFDGPKLDVPEEFRASAIAALEAEGVQPTEPAVQRMYSMHKAQEQVAQFGDEIVPPSARAARARALGRRPRKKDIRAAQFYWAYRRMGFDDVQARRRVGLPQRVGDLLEPAVFEELQKKQLSERTRLRDGSDQGSK